MSTSTHPATVKRARSDARAMAQGALSNRAAGLHGPPPKQRRKNVLALALADAPPASWRERNTNPFGEFDADF